MCASILIPSQPLSVLGLKGRISARYHIPVEEQVISKQDAPGEILEDILL